MLKSFENCRAVVFFQKSFSLKCENKSQYEKPAIVVDYCFLFCFIDCFFVSSYNFIILIDDLFNGIRLVRILKGKQISLSIVILYRVLMVRTSYSIQSY